MIILGTVQFGLNYGINNLVGQITEQEVFQILNFAISKNITTIDTAAAYGTSEAKIGNYIKNYPKSCDFKIITKFNLKNGHSPLKSLEKSLENLKVDQVETIMFHNFEDFKNLKAQDLAELQNLKGSTYKKLGISLYTNQQIEEICDYDIFEVVQIPFNCLDNEILRGEVLKKLKTKSIETHTRSVFLQGLFFMDREKFKAKLNPLIKYLEQFDQIANYFEIEKGTLALQYALSKSYIDGVLIGVDSLEQMKQNIRMADSIVPLEAFKQLDAICVNEINLLNPAIWNN